MNFFLRDACLLILFVAPVHGENEAKARVIDATMMSINEDTPHGDGEGEKARRRGRKQHVTRIFKATMMAVRGAKGDHFTMRVWPSAANESS